MKHKCLVIEFFCKIDILSLGHHLVNACSLWLRHHPVLDPSVCVLKQRTLRAQVTGCGSILHLHKLP